MNIRKNFFLERVVRHRNRLPGEVIVTVTGEFKKCVDVVLQDMD